MPPRCGRPRAQQWQVESSTKATYETNLLAHLALTLGRGGFFSKSREHAKSLRATSFEGFTDLAEVISWLIGNEKILEEDMQYLNEDNEDNMFSLRGRCSLVVGA